MFSLTAHPSKFNSFNSISVCESRYQTVFEVGFGAAGPFEGMEGTGTVGVVDSVRVLDCDELVVAEVETEAVPPPGAVVAPLLEPGAMD